MIATGLLITLLAAAPAADVPPNVAGLLTRHCAGCHTADSGFDLGTPPPSRDRTSWALIQKALETGRMPPSARDGEGYWQGPGKDPPPLGPGHRQELVGAIAAMLGEGLEPTGPRTHVQLSLEDWLLMVREVGRPFMTEEALKELVGPRLEFAPEARPHLISNDVCARIIDIELGRAPADRKLLRAFPRALKDPPGSAQVREGVQSLFRHVFQMPSTDAELTEGQARFQRFLRVTGSPRDATVALCTSYLSSARLLRLEFTGALPGK